MRAEKDVAPQSNMQVRLLCEPGQDTERWMMRLLFRCFLIDPAMQSYKIALATSEDPVIKASVSHRAAVSP